MGVEAEQDMVRTAVFDIIKEDLGTRWDPERCSGSFVLMLGHRLPIAQTWLNEEWLQAKALDDEAVSSQHEPWNLMLICNCSLLILLA